MRILVLILASDSSHEYVEFQAIWRMYMNHHPGIDCYFYKGDPTLQTEAILHGDTLTLRIEESLDTVYEKTMQAFRYFEPRLGKYDFVYRTNLSSFVDFEKYLEVCAGLPKTRCCAAFIGYDGDTQFPSGSGFTLSPDLVRRLVLENPPKVVQDDVTLGHVLHRWGIPIHGVNRVDYLDDQTGFLYWFPEMPAFHYRVKSDDRKHDVRVLRALVNIINKTPPTEWRLPNIATFMLRV